MLGLETALAIVHQTMVATGLLTWQGVAERMSVMPAKIGGYLSHGQNISPLAVANLTIFDPTATATVDRDLVASRSRNTPFHGMEFQGHVVATFFNGSPTLLLDQLSPSKRRIS